MDNDAVLVTTMNDIPGYKVVAVYGEVFGLMQELKETFDPRRTLNPGRFVGGL